MILLCSGAAPAVLQVNTPSEVLSPQIYLDGNHSHVGVIVISWHSTLGPKRVFDAETDVVVRVLELLVDLVSIFVVSGELKNRSVGGRDEATCSVEAAHSNVSVDVPRHAGATFCKLC